MMRHLMTIAMFAFLLASTVAHAAAPVPMSTYQRPRDAASLTAVALTANAAARTTPEIPIGGHSQVTAYVEYTRGGTGAATHITLTCWAGRATGKLGPLAVLSESATPGTSDSVAHTWRQAVSASAIIRWVITPLNDELLQCRVGSAGVVTADDVITRLDYRLGVL